MESTITGTVGEVAGRTVNTSRGEGTIFDVTIGSQKVSTFKSPIAEEARLLQGATVEATVDITQKGDYTNYTLLAVKLVDHNGIAPARASASTIQVAPVADAKKGWQPEDTARVTKLSCLSTAFAFVAAHGDDEDTALRLAQRLYGIAMGQERAEQYAEHAAAGNNQPPTETTDGIPW